MWQIFTILDGNKFYLGQVDNEQKAAILHDILAIQVVGTRAQTNFDWTKQNVMAILGL